MIKPPPDYRRKIAPHRVFFTWDITYKCNYRCSYCNFNEPGGWKEPEPTLYPGLDTWVEVWRRIYEKYGSCEIHCAGGEPFVYPDFMDLIEKLSKMHTLEFSTNLHWDPEDFIKRIRPGRARIGVSFHPEFVSFETFFEKVLKLKNAGFEVWVNYVGYPPIFKGMEQFKEKFEGLGVAMSILPFKGEYENRKYPEGYTEEEKQYLKKCAGADLWTQKTMDFAFVKEKRETKSRLCRMGQMYAKIHSNGDAFSCCSKTARKLGNLIADTFSLLEEPSLCEDDNCPCWKGMVIDKEPHWAEHWVVPPDARYISKLCTEDEERNVENKLRVALVQSPAWGIFDPPVALAQLSSCLKDKGYRVTAFDINIELYRARKEEYRTVWAIEQSSFWCNKENVSRFFLNNCELIEEWIKRIISFEPDIIGFSVNNASLYSTLEFAQRIKQKNPAIKIVFGGPMFLVPTDIKSIIRNDYVDIIVLGEGEETFGELVEMLKKDICLCKGIVYKKEGKIIQTESRPLISNLDRLPFLDFTDLALDKYDPPGHLGKHISLMTSRGCILNCVFCGPRAYWPGFRFMGGKRMYDEVQYHFKKNPDIEHIEFLDLELNGNIKALIEFCDLMIACPPKRGIRWHANIVIRPEMNKELLFKMKEGGCHHLSIGIETGSQRVLDLMNKRYKVEDAERVLKYAHEVGIHVTTNFMFGFPQERKEDFNLTLEFLRRNAAIIGTVYPSRSFFTIEPDSYIEKHMDEFGMVPNPDNNLYWESRDGKNNYPERLRRCEEFSKLALELGVSIGLGLQTSLELDRYYNLGFYYESKKDFTKAESFYTEYLKLDPKNSAINRKVEEFRSAGLGLAGSSKVSERDESTPGENGNHKNISRGNGRVSFNWDINVICNYRCPYCWFYGKWAEMKVRNINITISEIKEFWLRIFKRYGQIKLFITGGEPFLYPGFIDLMSSIADWHKVEVVTNLSWPVKPFIDRIQSPSTKFHPSFHPLFADFTEFIDKIILLKEKGLAGNPSYVAWPPQIPKVKYYVDKFKEYGVDMFVQTFFGEYKGNKYPDSYTDAEKEAITPYLGERGGKPFQLKPLSTKGRLCYAGCIYGVIHPNGDILRCGGLHSEDAKVGNMANNNFKLFEQAYPCTAEVCPCNEWAFLLKEKNEKIYKENR